MAKCLYISKTAMLSIDTTCWNTSHSNMLIPRFLICLASVVLLYLSAGYTYIHTYTPFYKDVNCQHHRFHRLLLRRKMCMDIAKIFTDYLLFTFRLGRTKTRGEKDEKEVCFPLFGGYCLKLWFTHKNYMIIYSYLLVETANGASISSFSVVVVVAVRRRSPRSA